MLSRKRDVCNLPVTTKIFRRKRPAAAPAEITGVLGLLPPELVGAIIDALLAQPDLIIN